MFVAALFMIAKIWNHTQVFKWVKDPFDYLIISWGNKCDTSIQYNPIKMNKILINAAKWMDLQIILLNDNNSKTSRTVTLLL